MNQEVKHIDGQKVCWVDIGNNTHQFYWEYPVWGDLEWNEFGIIHLRRNGTNGTKLMWWGFFRKEEEGYEVCAGWESLEDAKSYIERMWAEEYRDDRGRWQIPGAQ